MAYPSLVNKIFFTLLFVLQAAFGNSQTKVAILDFENTSGISKYDGFGKALSNMLITDLKNSIHPRKVTFLERSQLNKILSEQNLQKSKNFDRTTAVSFGKLAGVKYVLVGSVYVMDGTCNITSRLVDVQTSEIVHAKESNGSISKWLSLKTVLAQELSTAMNNPVTIEAEFTSKETSEGVITQYAKVIGKMDEGDVEGAQEMTEMLSAVQPDFKYFDELKLDIEELKKQVKENTEDISQLKKSGGLVVEAETLAEYMNNIYSTLLTEQEKAEIAKAVILKFESDSSNTHPFSFVMLCNYGHTEFQDHSDFVNRELAFSSTINEMSKRRTFLEWLLSACSDFLSRIESDRIKSINKVQIVESIKLYLIVLNEYHLYNPVLTSEEHSYMRLSYIADDLFILGSKRIGDDYNKRGSIWSVELQNLRDSIYHNLFRVLRNDRHTDPNVIDVMEKIYDRTGKEEKYENLRVNYLFTLNYYLRIILRDKLNNLEPNKPTSSFRSWQIEKFRGGDWLSGNRSETIDYFNLPFVETNGRLQCLETTNTNSYVFKKKDAYLIENSVFYNDNFSDFKPEIKKKYNEYFSCLYSWNVLTVLKNGLDGTGFNNTVFDSYFNDVLHYDRNDFEAGTVSRYDPFEALNSSNSDGLTPLVIDPYLIDVKFGSYRNLMDTIKKYESQEQELSIDYNRFLICDFLPEGTPVSIRMAAYSSEKNDYIVINSNGKLKSNSICYSRSNMAQDYPKYSDMYRDAYTPFFETKKCQNVVEIIEKSYQASATEYDVYEKERDKYFTNIFKDINIDPATFFKDINWHEDKVKYFRLVKSTEIRKKNKNRFRNETYRCPDSVPFLLDDQWTLLTDTNANRTSLKKGISIGSFLQHYFSVQDSLVYFNIYSENTGYASSVVSVSTEEYAVASQVNRAHAVLIYGFHYDMTFVKKAINLFKKTDLNFAFGPNYNNVVAKDMITTDLNDFVLLGILDERTKNRVITELGIKP